MPRGERLSFSIAREFPINEGDLLQAVLGKQRINWDAFTVLGHIHRPPLDYVRSVGRNPERVIDGRV